MDISLGKLQQLVTVARLGSVSKAAQELNISQPALSRSIAAIEDRYGFRIFNRLGHGVELTAAGVQVISQAQPILQDLRVFDSNMGLLGAGKAGLLAIGMAPLLASQMLATYAASFFGQLTDARLNVIIRPGSLLLESLKSDEIELFFYPDSYIEADADVLVETIGYIDPVCVVRREHPLAGKGVLSLKDIAGVPWASSVLPPVIKEELNPPHFMCDNYHVLRDAVLASDLICICSKAFVADQLADGTLQEIRVESLPLPKTGIHTAVLRGRVLSPLAQEAVERVRDYLVRI